MWNHDPCHILALSEYLVEGFVRPGLPESRTWMLVIGHFPTFGNSSGKAHSLSEQKHTVVAQLFEQRARCWPNAASMFLYFGIIVPTVALSAGFASLIGEDVTAILQNT